MEQTPGGMKPITTATIADIYIEQGLYDKALEVYQELLADNPQDAAVQQKISELQALIDNAGQAPAEPSPPPTPEPAATEPIAAEPHPVGTDGVIDKLNNWLASIQSRRNRV